MYVDESGDTGVNNSPTRYYILSGLILHETAWKEVLDELIAFRKVLRESYNLKLREEIHSTNFINNPGKLFRIKRNTRIHIMKKCIDWVSENNCLNVISVIKEKQINETPEIIFERTWQALIQRFENTIENRNFRGPRNKTDKGMIISDKTHDTQVIGLLRKMRHFNPVPNMETKYPQGSRNLRIKNIVEDPFMKNSKNSFFHQIVDVISYCARQLYEPNTAMKKKGGHNFYQRLSGAVVQKASSKNV